MKPTLYSFWRSSAAFRVRIVLNLKGIEYDTVPVHLRKGGGEQLKEPYQSLNPNGLVPLYVDHGVALHQSSAIIEYLEEKYPTPTLLPTNLEDRAWVRALAQDIAADIHPLNNLRVLRYLAGHLGIGDEKRVAWYAHWIKQGLTNLEKRLAQDLRVGQFCYGDQPGIADAFLVPQVFNAYDAKLDFTHYPTLQRIVSHCMQLPTFIHASWEHQVDAEGANPQVSWGSSTTPK
jgi:maleylacetoacetate isomerase/maleylpyruvate isomerase